jgi:phosphoribosylformylglycinamidine synthase
MLYKARVEVSLKPGHSDPEGATTAQSLVELSYPIKSVTISKIYTLTIEVNSAEQANSQIGEICRRLLANPTKDDYSFQVEKAE